jgi:hypothetical protein
MQAIASPTEPAGAEKVVHLERRSGAGKLDGKASTAYASMINTASVLFGATEMRTMSKWWIITD